ncbi:MAG: 3-dehydroquinate synthase [Prevotella sp.]|nr:3-dehydroquinate synthase [Prevotella sp.]
MNPQKVVMSQNLEEALTAAIATCEKDRIFILADETTQQLCLPLVEGFACLKGAQRITIGATDTHKTLDSLSHVWEALGEGGATRHSLLINIGGGMVTDLGGFAASTFKRGINYINIPTTLLSMVDASVGGKTGINFRGLKNEIGVFNNAETVILDTQFLKTLDQDNILSGYAEMLKHGLISDEKMWAELLNYDLRMKNLESLQRMVAESVAVKQRIVTEDPTEQGIRKALNLGHTAGHAFESFALSKQPILHGYAVAFGLICELYLSCIKTGFPTDKMHQTVSFIHEHYGKMDITCDDYPQLLEFMTHDKKNVAGVINFTLLGGIGDIRINQYATKDEIYEALDFYRES